MAITQTISTFPPAPNINLQTPEVFSERCDDYHEALITFSPEVNTLVEQINETAGDMQSSYTLAKDWATKLNTEVVTGQGYSARHYALESFTYANNAQESQDAAEDSAALAQNWATKTTGEVVIGQGYSAKYWAQVAQSSISVLPEGTINDLMTSPSTAWSSQKLSSIEINADLIAADNNATATYIEGLFNAT